MSAYLDNIALVAKIVAKNMNALKEMFLDLGKECRKIGLAVNL